MQHNNNFLLSARRRPFSEFLVKEYERKVSEFYGADIHLTAIGMDCWLCTNNREIDNVVLCFDKNES